MVYKLDFSFPKRFGLHSVVVASFFLAFFYIVELAIGVRTVVYVFQLWDHTRVSSSKLDNVSWMVVVGSLLLCVVTSCTVNAISAFWDSNNSSAVRSAIFYAIHILTGGVIWRYIRLLRCESSETKKEQAMFIASLKFFFTQSFTIPLLVIHIFLLCNMYELIYDFILIFGIAVSLMLTCVVFDQYEQCGEYPHETMALVPLLFKAIPPKTQELADEKSPKEVNTVGRKDHIDIQWKKALWKIVVGIQVFFFTFGRLLALGILLKLAGVYGITIIFLQILLSLLYLKFQTNYLVPEALSKFKQLLRLSFLSYILVFEWQLHRDASTGYTLKSGVKHGILYYSITTVESMFYLVFWAVTFNEAFSSDVGISLKYQHVLIVTSIGCLSLLTSYAIHISVILAKVKSCPSVFTSPRRLYPRIRVILKNPLQSRGVSNSSNPVPTINISSFTESIKETNVKENNNHNLDAPQHALGEEQYGSYKDLRESIGENDAINLQTSSIINKQIQCVSSAKGMEMDIKEHDQYCKNGAEGKQHTAKNEEMMPKLPKRGIPSPNFLKRSKSTGNLTPTKDLTKTKDSKDFSFLRTLKESSKILQEKQSTKQTDASTNGNAKHSNVYSKITAVSSSISSQLSKLANFKDIKIFPRKGGDTPRENYVDAKISIPTIMNAYKEELEMNPDELNLDTNRPVVPPRTFRPVPKERKKKSIAPSGKPDEKRSTNFSGHPENPNRRTLSESAVDEKLDSVPHKEGALQEGDYNYHGQSVENCEIFDASKNYSIKEDASKVSHPFSEKTFETVLRVYSPPLSSEERVADDMEETYCVSDNCINKSGQYTSEAEINSGYEEDVVFDANLKLGDISVSSQRVELGNEDGGISTAEETLESPFHNKLKSVSEIEHYV